MIRQERVKLGTCPACSKDITVCAEHIDHPSVFDIFLCVHCAEILEIEGPGAFRIAGEDHPARHDDRMILARYALQTQLWKRRY